MTLGTYPLGVIALGAKETPESILTVQSTLTGLSSNNVTLSQVHTLVVANGTQEQSLDEAALSQIHTLVITDEHHSHTIDNVALTRVLVIHKSAFGLMSGIAEMFTLTPNLNRTHNTARVNRITSPEAANRTAQPTNDRTLRI